MKGQILLEMHLYVYYHQHMYSRTLYEGGMHKYMSLTSLGLLLRLNCLLPSPRQDA